MLVSSGDFLVLRDFYNFFGFFFEVVIGLSEGLS